MTHYERLGITRDASREQIKRAFRERAMKTHPDLRTGSPKEIRRASREFGDLSNAYRGLIDPVKRAAYDHTLGPDRSSNPSPARAATHGEVKPRHLVEDYQELDAIRVEIWNEPRSDFLRQTLLYTIFLVMLGPIYYLLLMNFLRRWNTGESVWRSFLGMMTIPCLGLWVTWVISVRFQRIRACGGLRKFWRRTPRRRRQPRPGSTIELGSLPLVLLLLGFFDALVMYASDTLGEGFRRGVVMSIVPLVVLVWIGKRRKDSKP